jgi:hypothetical protein
MKEEGLIEDADEPTDEEIRRYDKKRKNKKVSNDDWQSPADPDSRITKMKDGRTHLAYKAEHVIDLESEFLLAAEVHPGNAADTQTMLPSLTKAQENLREADVCKMIEEVAADKGYHSAELLEESFWWDGAGMRTYIAEPARKKHWDWQDRSWAQQQAVCGNHRRMKGARAKRLQRLRSERVERSFAHVCETGGARRTWLRGLDKVKKRYQITAAARNLGLLMRKLFGVGTPRALQGLFSLLYILQLATARFKNVVRPSEEAPAPTTAWKQNHHPLPTAI